MEVIQISEIKENLINIITNQIKNMSEEEFINFSSTIIDLFNKEQILTFTDSFDNSKIKLTYLQGVNGLIKFLEYVQTEHKNKIKEHLILIKYLLLSE